MNEQSPITGKPPSNFAGLQLKIDYVPIDSLKPAKARMHHVTRAKLKQIARAQERFGNLVPIIATADHDIVAGHARWDAAKLNGYSVVPVIRIEHLTEAELLAFSVFDNKVADGRQWKNDVLLEIFDTIEVLEPNLEIVETGFAIAEIDTLYGRARTNELSDFDECPEQIDAEPISRPGDIFVAKRHRIGCGDARDRSFVARVLDTARPRMVLTDSPWNLPIKDFVSGMGKRKHDNFVMGCGEWTKPEFTTFLVDFIKALQDHLIDGALLYLFMDWRNLDALMAAANACALVQKNLLVWSKDNAGMGSMYRSQHELIGLFKHGDAPYVNNVALGRFGRNRSNILCYPGANSFGKARDKSLEAHPTSKGVGMLADLILDASEPGDVIFDPFAGSGSMLIAAEKTERIACTSDLDPKYVDAVIRRFEAATGHAPVHEGTGLTLEALGRQRAITDPSALGEGADNGG